MRSWLYLALVLPGTTDTCRTKTSRNDVLPRVTGFSSAPNRGARKVFAQAVESGPPLPDKSKCGACLGVHRNSQRKLAKVIVVPPPGMITLDEAAERAGVTRLNFDYHRKRGHVTGAEVRSHGPNGEKRSYIVEDFQVTIPKPQKRTRPAIDGRPDLIPFGTAARLIGMETQDVQAPCGARPDPRRDADARSIGRYLALHPPRLRGADATAQGATAAAFVAEADGAATASRPGSAEPADAHAC